MALVAVAAVAAAIVGGIWLSRYAPLEWSGTGSFGPGQTNLARVADPASGSEGKPVFFPRYRRGGQFSFGFDLSNAGPLAVRLDGLVRDGGPSFSALRVDGLGLAPAPGAPAIDDAEPFHPVMVEPGESVWLVVHLRMNCAHMAASSAETLQQIPLRYTYLKFLHGSAWVEPPAVVTLNC